MKYFMAGGAVRNLLQGLEPSDYDYAFSGTEDEFTSLHPGARKLGFGPAYLLNGHEYTALKDGNISSDLAKRDFTINCLLLEENGLLHMHPETLKDLAAKSITPAAPDALLRDPLRIFRAARITAVYPDFNTSENCVSLMREAAGQPEFAKLAAERVGRECVKALLGSSPGNFLRVLGHANALHYWFEELAGSQAIPAGPLKYHQTDVLEHIARVMDSTVEEYNRWLAGESEAELKKDAARISEIRQLCVWMALCHDLGKVNTPSDVLPHHYQHEARGMRAASSLAGRLRLPERMRVAGILAAKLHMKAGIYNTLRPSTRVDMLMETYAKRLMLPLFLLAQADSGDHTLLKSAVRDLMLILNVKLAPQWKDQGKASGKKLRELRCQRLAAMRTVAADDCE